MPDQLGDYIRELREGSDEFRSLRQFADALGKSPSWVSKVERNLEVPGTETLLQISDLLKANPDELLRRADKLDPEVEKALIERYTEVVALLRTIKDMTPQQIDRLKAQAEVIREEGERYNDNGNP